MSEYYKSLISDDEVIRELIKESKRREGKLPSEVTRLRPNLNFFQRTVSSLVSNNTRLDRTKDAFKSDFIKDCVKNGSSKSYNSIGSPLKQKFESNKSSGGKLICDGKIRFVKSTERLTKANIHSTLFGVKSGTSKKVPTSTAVCADDLESAIDTKRTLTCKTASPKLRKSLKTIDNSTDVIILSSDDSSVEIIADCPSKETSTNIKKHRRHREYDFKHKKRKKKD